MINDHRIFEDVSSTADEKWVYSNSSNNSSVPISAESSKISSYPISLTRLGCDKNGIHQWEITLPSCYSVNLWQRFVFEGANPIGLQERQYIDTKINKLSFPRDFPDNMSGIAYWRDKIESEKKALLSRMKHMKKPKVVKSNKLPRFFDWKPIMAYRNVVNEAFTVIRNKDYAIPFFPTWVFQTHHTDINSNYRLQINDSSVTIDPDMIHDTTLPNPTLIKVVIRSTGRGIPVTGATLLQPLVSDYVAFTNHRLNREKITTSGRRLGEWRGCVVDRNNNSTRHVIGLLTSHSDTNASGFCDIIKLQFTFQISEKVVSGVGRTLVMFHNPDSNWIRPAILELMF
jgi:hypothetical protein